MSAVVIRKLFQKSAPPIPAAVPVEVDALRETLRGTAIGLIAGSSNFPIAFIEEAKRYGCEVVAVAHQDETDSRIETVAKAVQWIKVGELGKLIAFFKAQGVEHVALAGGIDRVRLFGNVKVDPRGAALLLRVRSMKDDLIMRGIADELLTEGMTVVPCTVFLAEQMAQSGLLAGSKLSRQQQEDIAVGASALRAMSAEHIGQTVVVAEGVVVAVEAVEGTDRCIKRGGQLAKGGCVVVKCAKTNQDMRFDVPTIGPATLEQMHAVGANVLAVEAGRTLMLESEQLLKIANQYRISIVGIDPLEEE